MTLTDKLAEIKSRCDAATEGPWKRCHHLQSKEQDKTCPCGFPGDIWGADREHVVCTMGPHLHAGDEAHMTPPRYEREQEINNGIFIAHARTDIPKLLAVIEKQEQIISNLLCRIPESFGERYMLAKDFESELMQLMEGK